LLLAINLIKINTQES